MVRLGLRWIAVVWFVAAGGGGGSTLRGIPVALPAQQLSRGPGCPGDSPGDRGGGWRWSSSTLD